MELWTRQRDQIGWKPWPDVPQGLVNLLEVSDVQVLLLTEAPDAEHDLLIASLRLIRALAGNGGHIVVASPHPSADLIESLAPVGVDQIWVVERRGLGRSAAIGKISEIDDAVCPHLHSSTEGGTALSVCGCHHDRMVLARHHLDRWCLNGSHGCPHRHREGPNA